MQVSIFWTWAIKARSLARMSVLRQFVSLLFYFFLGGGGRGGLRIYFHLSLFCIRPVTARFHIPPQAIKHTPNPLFHSVRMCPPPIQLTQSTSSNTHPSLFVFPLPPFLSVFILAHFYFAASNFCRSLKTILFLTKRLTSVSLRLFPRL